MDEMNYNEQLLQAFQIVAQGEIKKIHFDQTIKAIIIGDEAADEGRYWCSNGFSEFWAYSTEVRYRKNDKVLVTIPEGDYSNTTKVIISKQADENNSPLILASPLAMMVDLTNNMITGEIEDAIWANYGRENNIKDSIYSWDKDTKDFISSAAIRYGKPFYDSGINKIYETSISRLGFSAQFSTWLTEYSTIGGNYGIAIELTFRDNDRAETAQPYSLLVSEPVTSEIYFKKDSNNVYSELTSEERQQLFDIFTTDAKKLAGIKFFESGDRKGTPNGSYILSPGNEKQIYRYAPTNEFLKYITFDSDEFFGDIYGYETYYTNETVFDLSEFSKYAIIRIRAWLYERDNFRTMNGEYVEAPTAGDFSNINPNIFMKDPYLCLGVEASEFTSDRAELTTSSSSTFYKTLKSPDATKPNETAEERRIRENLKYIKLKWTHKDENTGIIRLVEEDEYPEDYEIRWYRWALGKPSCDEFSGAHWERFYGCKDTPNGEGDFAITEEEIKALNGSWSKDPTNTLNTILIPNINRSQEKIKAIILKKEIPTLTTVIQEGTKLTTQEIPGDIIYRFAAETPEITFLNDDEVRNEQTYIDVNALSIRFDDGSNGHYFLYNRAGNVSRDSDLEIRTLTLVFDENETDVYKKPLVPSSVPIRWHFPESGTMITPATSSDLSAKPSSSYNFSNTVSVGYFIKKSLSRQDNNNTVTAEAIIDGITYSAAVQMAFGTAGTSGSDYTLDIVWNDNALDVTKPKQGLLIGEVGLFDSAGNQLLGDSETITDLASDYELKYEWEVAELIDEDEVYDYPYETNNILYPTFQKAEEAAFDNTNLETGVSDSKTYGGYYYFVDNKTSLCNRFNAMCGMTSGDSPQDIRVFNGTTFNEDVLNNNRTDILTNMSKSSETLAFFNIDEEKFIYLKDYFSKSENLTQEIIDKILFNTQLYRKRDVENLRVVKTIKNEQFYKDLIDVFFTNSNQLYTNLLNTSNINTINAFVDTYNLRFKDPKEIGATRIGWYYKDVYTTKTIVDSSSNTELVKEEEQLLPFEAILQDYFQKIKFYLNSNEEESEKIVLPDSWQTIFETLITDNNFTGANGFYLGITKIKKPNKNSEDVTLTLDNEVYYEQLFNTLFETNNFYYKYIQNNIEIENAIKTNVTLSEDKKYFYAKPYEVANQPNCLQYIIQSIAATSGKENKRALLQDLIDSENNFDLYLCYKVIENNNVFKEEEIPFDNNKVFTYEWEKPKFDYKVIDHIEGKDEDYDGEYKPRVFGNNSSEIWKTDGVLLEKNNTFYDTLAKCIFPTSLTNLSSEINLTTTIDNLYNQSNKVRVNEEDPLAAQNDDNDLYIELNGKDILFGNYLRGEEGDATREEIIQKLVELCSTPGNPSQNWLSNYNWRYDSKEWLGEGNSNNTLSKYFLYNKIQKTIFNNVADTLTDIVLMALEIGGLKAINSNYQTSHQTEKTSLLNVYKRSQLSNNNYYLVKSLYSLLTTGINSSDKQKEIYQTIKNNLNNYYIYTPKSIINDTFSNGNSFYRTLAEFLGISSIYDDIDSTETDKLIFYNAFNQSAPVGINSRQEQEKYISNILVSNSNENKYYRLENYLNLFDNLSVFKNGLGASTRTIGLINSSISQDAVDSAIVDILETLFDKDKDSLSEEEKHNLITQVFSSNTSGAINNYVNSNTIVPKEDIPSKIAGQLDYLYQSGSLNINTTKHIINSNKAFTALLSKINSAASSSSYVNYFSNVYSGYTLAYNRDVLYRKKNNTNWANHKWELLYCLICNNGNQLNNNIYEYQAYDTFLTDVLGNTIIDSDNNTYQNNLSEWNNSTVYYLQSTNDAIDYTAQVSSVATLWNQIAGKRYKQISTVFNNSRYSFYLYSGPVDITEGESTTTKYRYTKINDLNNTKYINFLKSHFYNLAIKNNVYSLDNISNIITNKINVEELCKYLLNDSTQYYTEFLKNNKDDIGIFSSGSTSQSGLNSADIPFIKYSDGTYDNLTDYLTEIIETGRNNTFYLDSTILSILTTALNETSSEIIITTKFTDKNSFINTLFNILIAEGQNENKTTILTESLNNLDTFIAAYLSNENFNTVNSRTLNQQCFNNFADEELIAIPDYLVPSDSNESYYENLKEILKSLLKAANKNPVSYADNSLALKGWRERMYTTVNNFYNNLNYNNLIQFNKNNYTEEEFFFQFYSALFGVNSSSNVKRYIQQSNPEKYIYTTTSPAYGPIINYVLLLTKIATLDRNNSENNQILNVLSPKTGLTTSSLNDNNYNVYIVNNNSRIRVNSVLKLSNGSVTLNSLTQAYQLLDNTNKYYKDNTNNDIGKMEAFKRLFLNVYNDLNVTVEYQGNSMSVWEYLIKLYYTGNTSSTAKTPILTTNSLFTLYDYGPELNLDNSENFLYNLDEELRNCFSGTTFNQEKFFELLDILEGENTYIYEYNSINNGLSTVWLIDQCSDLWSIDDSVSDVNYIQKCQNDINNLIKWYYGIIWDGNNPNAYNNKIITTYGSAYNINVNGVIKTFGEVFNQGQTTTIEQLKNSYYIIINSNNYIYKKDNNNIMIQGNSVFNYDNNKHLKPFIKVNDVYILDYHDSYHSDETYYYPKQREKEKGKTIPLVYSPKGSKGRFVQVYPNPVLAANNDIQKLMLSLSVLKVTLSNFGDYDLVAYFPIAVKQGTRWRSDLTMEFTPGYIQGATYVRYSVLGETDFEKNPYRIFSKSLQGSSQILYDDLRLKNADVFGWKIIHPPTETNVNANFVPSLKESQGISQANSGELSKLPILQPITVFIPEAVPYGITCYYNNNEIPIWTQSIYCYEDNYPSTTINKWDGKTITTDEESGTIVSSALAAGKKESDNTFTGVMIGDWSRTDTDVALTKHTGLYGFNHGSMSYAFKDDGTGFIGKDGRGRIIFDGNKSQIYSNNWKGTQQCGMFLDIDDGVLKLQSETTNNEEFYSIPNYGAGDEDGPTISNPEPVKESNIVGQRFITLSSKASTYPLAIGLDKSVSQRKFRVRWDGSSYMENAYLKDAYLDNVYASGYINAQGGKFTKEINCEHGTIKGAYITCRYLEANIRGDIAGWTIAANGLINEDHSTMLLTNTADIELKDADGKVIQKINNPFQASIVTNRIAVQAKGLSGTGQFMELGYLTGTADGISQTEGMGIKGPSRIILESSSPGDDIAHIAIALKATAGVVGLFGKSVQMSLGGAVEKAEEGIYIQAQGLQVNVPADAQTGIYARFA